MRIDQQLAEQWIAPNSRVLDLGCGNGELLHHLQTEFNVFGYGIEMDSEKMNEAIAKGLNVIEQDLNDGLANFADGSFDTVVMARTLQAVDAPDQLLLDMLRVGKQVIVTFPNFAHWQNRVHLGLKGIMPMSETLPHKWYNTPNIHLSTFNDFKQLCDEHGITILDHVAVSEDSLVQGIKTMGLMAEMKLRRNKKLKSLQSMTSMTSMPSIKGLHKKVNQVVDGLVTSSPNLLADMAIFRVSR